MGRRSNPPGSRIARVFLLKFGFCRELPSPLQKTYQHSAVDAKHEADARGAGDGDRRARHMSYGSHAWRWRLSPASFRDLQPSTAKWSVNGRRVGRHPGEGLMLPLRGGVREVEEWFVQAFSRINSTLTLILTLALSRPCSPSPSPSPRLHPRPRPTYVTLALTLTLA